jgi:hypothetical protein
MYAYFRILKKYHIKYIANEFLELDCLSMKIFLWKCSYCGFIVQVTFSGSPDKTHGGSCSKNPYGNPGHDWKYAGER